MSKLNSDDARTPALRVLVPVLALLVAATFSDANAAGPPMAGEPSNPVHTLLEGSGIEVSARKLGLWVETGPDCRRIVGSEDAIAAGLNLKVRYRCTSLLGSSFTVICDLHALDCPPRNYRFVTFDIPQYNMNFNKLIKMPDQTVVGIDFGAILEEIPENENTLLHEGSTPVAAEISGLELGIGIPSAGFGSGIRFEEDEQTEEETTMWTVGIVGFDAATSVGIGYGYDHGGGSVRLGPGSFDGVGEFVTDFGVGVDLVLE